MLAIGSSPPKEGVVAQVLSSKLTLKRNPDSRIELAVDWRIVFTAEEVRWNAFYHEGVELVRRQGLVDDWTARLGIQNYTEADPGDDFLGTLAVQYFRPTDAGSGTGPLTLSHQLTLTLNWEQQRQLDKGAGSVEAYVVIHLEPDIPSEAVGWAFAEIPAIPDEGMKDFKVPVPKTGSVEELVRFDSRIVSTVLKSK
jgi:hypothetical protein